MISAMGQERLVLEAVASGAKSFIVKPFKDEQIVDAIKKILVYKIRLILRGVKMDNINDPVLDMFIFENMQLLEQLEQSILTMKRAVLIPKMQ